ncbi:MAG: FliM/FliN family flagellar motor switch protein [Holosporales bacterium]
MVASKKNAPPSSGEGSNPLVSSQEKHDSFPILEMIFERFCHNLSITLQNLASVDAEVSFKGTKTLHFERYLEEIKDPSVWGVFRAEEWDNDCVIVTSPFFLRPLLELTLGGFIENEPPQAPSKEETGFTLVERHLIQKILQVFLESLSAQFQEITPVKFTLSGIENNTRRLVVLRNTTPCVIGCFSLNLDRIQSEFQIIFPYTAIQPVRSILAESFLGEKMGKDALWLDHIHEELPQAHVALEAVLDEVHLKLWEILKWEKGSSFFISTTPDSNIEVKCLGEPIFMAKMGQKNGRLAIAVEELLLKPKEKEDEIQAPTSRLKEEGKVTSS